MFVFVYFLVCNLSFISSLKTAVAIWAAYVDFALNKFSSDLSKVKAIFEDALSHVFTPI